MRLGHEDSRYPSFQKYFPLQTFAAITCWSWIFNPQLQEILPPNANLVMFQRELYLYSAPPSGSGFKFIFGREDVTPKNGPRDTSLQRAILDFLAAGHAWRGLGCMFFLVEDLPQFGRQIYLTQWHKKQAIWDEKCRAHRKSPAMITKN